MHCAGSHLIRNTLMDVDEVKKNIKKKMYIAKFLFSNGILSCKESLYYYFSNQSFTNSIPFHIFIVSLSQFFFYNRKYENNRRTRIFSLRAIVPKKKKNRKDTSTKKGQWNIRVGRITKVLVQNGSDPTMLGINISRKDSVTNKFRHIRDWKLKRDRISKYFLNVVSGNPFYRAGIQRIRGVVAHRALRVFIHRCLTHGQNSISSRDAFRL